MGLGFWVLQVVEAHNSSWIHTCKPGRAQSLNPIFETSCREGSWSGFMAPVTAFVEGKAEKCQEKCGRDYPRRQLQASCVMSPLALMWQMSRIRAVI